MLRTKTCPHVTSEAEQIALKLEAKLATPPDFRFYAYHTTMAEFCWTNGISCIFGGLADEEYVRYPGPPERFFVSEEYGWKVVSRPARMSGVVNVGS